MIIEVKGTKSESTAVDPHEQYVLKNQDKRSNVPLYFGMFLTGLAVYLKSAFPQFDENARGEEPKPESEATSGPQEVASLKAVDTTPDTEQDEQDGAPLGSGGKLLDFPRSIFSLDDSPAINIRDLDLSAAEALRNFGGMSFSLRPANDNAWVGSNRAISRGNGGGGGHASSAPEEDSPDDYEFDGGDDDDDDDDNDDDTVANRAPRTSGPVYLLDVYGCAIALIGLADLLRNASDPDGDVLRVQNITTSSGTLTQTAEGWYFSAAMLGPVTITYQITDGEFSITQTAQFSVLKNPPVFGTDGSDVLLGTNCADEIDGRDGDDNIDSRGGTDTINGGNGNDHIVAGSGNDLIRAGDGDDVVFGGLGDDHIWGGNGNDRLFGDEGRDTIFGESGDDTIRGGSDDDMLFGGEGNDFVAGDLGDDTIDGESGDDRLEGGGGNDILIGQAGADILEGGSGDDFLTGGADVDVVRGSEGKDTIAGDIDGVADHYNGGEGKDALDYSAAQSTIVVDFEQGSASGLEIGPDTFSAVEVLRTGTGNDEILGSELDEEIHGNSGDDHISGAGGDDSLFGDSGRDVVQGGAGTDSIQGNDGNDHLSGGAGEDTVKGNAGDDVVLGDTDQATDSYDGGQGIDTLDYSAALMTVLIDLTTGDATGADIGDDSITNFEVIKSGAGADEIGGSIAGESIFGNGGDDAISGGGGDDTLCGGGGNDVIADGEGADCVLAGTGDDIVLAAADSSDDTYLGQAGFDTLDYSQSAVGVLIDLNTGQATGFEIGHDTIGGFESVVGSSGDDQMIVGIEAAVLRGGEGNDTFEFQIPAGSSGSEVMHQILDFMVGDRIEASKYHIFEEVMDSLEQRFEDVYGEQTDPETLPIRVRHEGTGELEQTLIEVDMDLDQHYELTINLTGHHVLMIVENA